MAEHLASIFGTEKDKVNCPFYFKIGACRHGERCSRIHNKPTISQTILIHHMYPNPIAVQNVPITEDDLEDHFINFYEDIFDELHKYGTIEELHVCDNICDHLLGNVYVKFETEEEAQMALNNLQGRFYAERPIMCEFSPVTDFREASCRQYEMGECMRGGLCNFMHLKAIPRDLYRQLFRHRRRHDHDDRRDRDRHRYDYRDEYEHRRSRRSRENSPGDRHSRSSKRHRRSSRDRGERSRERHRSSEKRDRSGHERKSSSKERRNRKRSRDSERSKDRERSSSRERSRERSQERSSSRERSRERSQERKSPSRERSRERSRDRERSKDRERSQEPTRERSEDRSEDSSPPPPL